MAVLDHFACVTCGEQLPPDLPVAVCPRCAQPLLAQYRLKRAAKPALSIAASASMWRYAELLAGVDPVTLGEGLTSLIPSRRHPGAYVKDEGRNPTGSVFARAASVVLSVAHSAGRTSLLTNCREHETAAWAAYCAASGIALEVAPGAEIPAARRAELELYGARFAGSESQGASGDCGLQAFTLEGIKTVSCEIAEQLQWKPPSALIWPDGASGVVALWKAFDEMRLLGWTEGYPRIFTVPISDEPFAAQARKIVQQTGGREVRTTAEERKAAVRAWAAEEGISAAIVGASSLAIYRNLLADGVLHPGETVVLINTTAGHRDAIETSWLAHPRSRNIGGIIQPS